LTLFVSASNYPGNGVLSNFIANLPESRLLGCSESISDKPVL
jgi:hypothetical protein